MWFTEAGADARPLLQRIWFPDLMRGGRRKQKPSGPHERLLLHVRRLFAVADWVSHCDTPLSWELLRMGISVRAGFPCELLLDEGPDRVGREWAAEKAVTDVARD